MKIYSSRQIRFRHAILCDSYESTGFDLDIVVKPSVSTGLRVLPTSQANRLLPSGIVAELKIIYKTFYYLSLSHCRFPYFSFTGGCPSLERGSAGLPSLMQSFLPREHWAGERVAAWQSQINLTGSSAIAIGFSSVEKRIK